MQKIFISNSPPGCSSAIERGGFLEARLRKQNSLCGTQRSTLVLRQIVLKMGLLSFMLCSRFENSTKKRNMRNNIWVCNTLSTLILVSICAVATESDNVCSPTASAPFTTSWNETSKRWPYWPSPSVKRVHKALNWLGKKERLFDRPEPLGDCVFNNRTSCS